MKRILATIVTGFVWIVIAATSTVQAQDDSASIYKSKCVMCHAADGSGNSPSGKALKAKDLRLDETQKKPDAELVEVITKGRNKMPAFGQKLKPGQIQSLVGYLRKLGKT